MAVMNAQYKHPASAYSQGLRDLIDSMLKVKPQDRPDIHEVRFDFRNRPFVYSLQMLMLTVNLGHP